MNAASRSIDLRQFVQFPTQWQFRLYNSDKLVCQLMLLVSLAPTNLFVAFFMFEPECDLFELKLPAAKKIRPIIIVVYHCVCACD